LCICNQEERTIDSEAIGVGERVEEDRREETSEEEGKSVLLHQEGVLVARSLTPNSQIEELVRD
jgi:hypothetical protein